MSRRMLLLSSLLAVVVIVGAFTFLGHNVPAAQTETKDSKLDALLKERLSAARAVVKVADLEYASGKTSFDRVHQATKALLRAELDLSDSDKERIRVLEEAVALAKTNETYAAERYKSGLVTQSDVLMAGVARLEAEIDLERAKCKPARR